MLTSLPVVIFFLHCIPYGLEDDYKESKIPV